MTEQDIASELIDIRLQLGLDFVGIATAIATGNQKEIRWKYVAGNRNNRYQKIVLQVGKGIAGIVWRTARPMIAEDLKTERQAPIQEYPIALTENLASIIAVPILSEGAVIAVMLGGNRKVTQLKEALITDFQVIANKMEPSLLAVKE
ncbi:GAF domain-containing protein [Listeria booriae]|uniref:GAF domain-containing protein n=1 Tax=Listeria booriae TaxID=1552123 RepID=UPI001626A663|nr:GAF domain-containing protein [Listeria booriae]MBC1530056.1 GAF domain-containing protein [Listeria booriae]MBC2256904.1 GAF domain-containing protein [Listeria booriae]